MNAKPPASLTSKVADLIRRRKDGQLWLAAEEQQQDELRSLLRKRRW